MYFANNACMAEALFCPIFMILGTKVWLTNLVFRKAIAENI